MRLIDNWKQSLKMHSVQLALVFTAVEWYLVLDGEGLPTTFHGWTLKLVGLFFILLRVVAQPELHKK